MRLTQAPHHVIGPFSIPLCLILTNTWIIGRGGWVGGGIFKYMANVSFHACALIC